VSQNAPPAFPLLGGLPGLLLPTAKSGSGPAQATSVFFAPSVPVSQGGPPQATSGLFGAAVPPQQGGPAQAASALFGTAVPAQQGGPAQFSQSDRLPETTFAVLEHDSPIGRFRQAPFRLASVIGVDLTVPGTTPLYGTASTSRAFVQFAVIRCTSASGFTSPAVVRFLADTNVIFDTTTLVGLDAAAKHFTVPVGLLLPVAEPLIDVFQQLSLVVDTPAVATGLLVSVDVFGREF